MRVLGQFNLGFIVAELDGAELFVVDQHASDEKANFEALQADEDIQSQRLLAFASSFPYQVRLLMTWVNRPRELQLTSLSESVILENEAIFRKNGFTFEMSHEGWALGSSSHPTAASGYQRRWGSG